LVLFLLTGLQKRFYEYLIQFFKVQSRLKSIFYVFIISFKKHYAIILSSYFSFFLLIILNISGVKLFLISIKLKLTYLWTNDFTQTIKHKKTPSEICILERKKNSALSQNRRLIKINYFWKKNTSPLRSWMEWKLCLFIKIQKNNPRE